MIIFLSDRLLWLNKWGRNDFFVINAPDMNSHFKKMLQPDILRTHVELLAAANYFQILHTIEKTK